MSGFERQGVYGDGNDKDGRIPIRLAEDRVTSQNV